MPEDCPAQSEGAATAKAILEKPLQQLTEDDIAQLTREDCRRYLKEKGMRRPSWNKSQAIQQVIMLKSLLESSPDADAGSSKRLRISCTANSNSDKSPAPDSVPTAEDAENSLSAEEMTHISQKDVENPDSVPPCFVAANEECTVPRPTGSSKTPVDQLTIFYGGKVNVYDNVSPDKARAIMNIAATSPHLMEERLLDNWAIRQTSISKTPSPKARPDSAAVITPLPKMVNMKNNTLENREGTDEACQESPEGPSTRKASLQRYLEKKKDRFKSKGKVALASCSSVNMYFSHEMCDQMPRRVASSTSQIRPLSTPAFCNSICDTVMKISHSSGLIYKGV